MSTKKNLRNLSDFERLLKKVYWAQNQLEEAHDSTHKLISELESARWAKSEGCFIATATFGDTMMYELNTFREFRDRILLRGLIGSAIVGAYYIVSPSIAGRIRGSQQLRRFMRSLLKPALKTCEFLLGRR